MTILTPYVIRQGSIMSSKRNLRRWASALAALMIAGSVLAVVAAPVQAANTASEALVDSNDDGKPDSREFAGRDRYATAAALADRYASERGDISTVIIASGVSLVDAVAAAGFASYIDAPILLTTPTRLHRETAKFIEDNDIIDVYVLGGQAAVSRSVADAIESLDSAPQVTRIAGDDRYDTAAEIAIELGGGGPWCGSNLLTAVMVNGTGPSFVDAVIVGPLAAALGVPILLTDGDTVASSTADFIEDNAIEQVVIVGGSTSVSEDIEEELIEDLGVIRVERIAGTSAAATAVAVAEAIGDCDDQIDVDTGTVALVNRYATADGVTAAPVLAVGIDGSGTTPLLLVEDDLPSATETYLEGTPDKRDGAPTHLGILAIGGTAVVSEDVMADAVSAANSGGDITVEIEAGEPDADGRRTFIVTFSADIDSGEAGDPSLYRIVEPGASIGRRLFSDEETTVGYREVVIDAGDPEGFAHGTALIVRGGAKVGVNGDQRVIEGARFTLPRAERDTVAPELSVAAFAGQRDFYVRLVEENLASGEAVVTGEVTVESKNGTALADPTVTQVGDNGNLFKATVSSDLMAGDKITVEQDSVQDTSDRQNRRVRYTVPEPKDALSVASVEVGPVNRTGDQATADLFGDSTVTVRALKSGKAAGAAGNGWRVNGYDDRDTSAVGYDADAEPDITVIVFTQTPGVIQYEINDGSGEVTQSDVIAAFESSRDFAANFEIVLVSPPANGETHPSATAQVDGDSSQEFGSGTETAGMSVVAVSVNFSDAVQSLASGCTSEALHGAGCNNASLVGRFVVDPPGDPVAPTGVAKFADATQTKVLITYTSDNEDYLPASGDTFVIDDGDATSYESGVSNESSPVRLRRNSRLTAEVPPAS